MLILSLECAGRGCALAVWRDGAALAVREERMERGQDSRLMPLVIEAMSAAGVTYDQLDRVAVTTGPGSFTGLRIGLATARGIGLAAGKPVIGIDRFSIFKTQYAGEGRALLVVLNAKRKEFFCRAFPAAEEASMMTEEEIDLFLRHHPATLRVGDSGAPLESVAREPEVLTSAALAALAVPEDPAFLPRPLYVRAPDVTLKKIIPTLGVCLPEHVDALVVLHAACFGASAWGRDQLAGSLGLPTTRGWMARQQHEILLAQSMGDEAEILTFCVSPTARRRGIAATLLAEARAHLGAARVFLDVAADNQAAIKLYEKSGFRQTGRRPHYYPTGDALLYEAP